MAEWGFGSPSTLPGVTTAPFDWGFGSPTPSSWTEEQADTGFGSPLTVLAPHIVGGLSVLPDSGGVLLSLMVYTWPVRGPYRARFYDADGNAHPAADYCPSGIGGQGTDLYTNLAREVLPLVVPPMPAGFYDLQIDYGAGWTETVTLSRFVRVMARNRHPSTYRLRRALPPLYRGLGARMIQFEPAIEL